MPGRSCESPSTRVQRNWACENGREKSRSSGDRDHSSSDSVAREFKVYKEVIMPLSSLREYLDKQNVKYIVISHSLAYTAQGIAAITHIPGKELAKTVMVKLDGRLVMAVLPASFHVDLKLLKKKTGANDAALASESEFKGQFPECETGAMPPFGNLYGIEVFADESLTNDEEIAFNAGSHLELIRLAWKDFERLVQPTVMHLVRESTSAAA